MITENNSAYYPIADAPNTTPFVYAIKFVGHNPIGTSAIVVATSSKLAIKAFLTYLFTYDAELYSKNSHCMTENNVSVFCQAAQNQLGKVAILTDGEY